LALVGLARPRAAKSPNLLQHGKAALGPQGRFAPLRGGLRPSLTAERRLAGAKTGRDRGMVSSIEQRDGMIGGFGTFGPRAGDDFGFAV